MHRAQSVASQILGVRTGAAIATMSLSNPQAQQLRSALIADARDAVYSGMLTIGEATQGLDRRLFTWATVKLYYSAFYLIRSLLGIQGIGLIYVGSSPFIWRASAGERPIKRSGNTHGVVLKAFKDFMPGNVLLSQTVGVYEPLDWLTAKREAANYKTVRFSEPDAPAHFLTVERYGIRRLLGDYLGDDQHLFAFDPDHAMLAFPIETMKLAIEAQRIAGMASLTPEEVAFLAGQCFDRNGPIADFRRLIEP